MARFVWARVWCDLLRHRNFRKRPDCDVRLVVGLILHAKEHSGDQGIVQGLDAEEMRGLFGIKATVQKVQEGLEYLIRIGWLQLSDDKGSYLIRDFADRQGRDQLEEPGSPKRPGKVYFIRATGSGRIKIGYSQNPWARLDKLRTGSSEPLELVCTLNGTVQDEHRLHERFKALKVNREWFNPGSDLLSFITTLPMKGSATGSEGSNYPQAGKGSYGLATTTAATPKLQQEEEVEVEVETRSDRSLGSGECEGRTSQAVDGQYDSHGHRLAELTQAQEVRREKAGIAAEAMLVDKPVEVPPIPANLSESERSHVMTLFRDGKATEARDYLAKLQGGRGIPIQKKSGAGGVS
jgi:hypothetical protein